MNKWTNEVTVDGEKMTAEEYAVKAYNKGEGASVDEIADFLGDEFQGKTKGRMVIAKLTQRKVYVKPEAAPKAERVPQIVKADLVANIEAAVDVEGFSLGTVARGNTDDLIRLAKVLGAELPDPR